MLIDQFLMTRNSNGAKVKSHKSIVQTNNPIPVVDMIDGVPFVMYTIPAYDGKHEITVHLTRSDVMRMMQAIEAAKAHQESRQ